MEKNKRQFRVIIESAEDGFFVASVPAIPGCHTQAQTIPELMDNVRDVIKLCLEVAKEDTSYRRRINFAYEPSFIGMEMVSI